MITYFKRSDMNSTKKYLIITAIIFCILGIGWDIYDIVMWFMQDSATRSVVFYVVYMFIEIACNIAVVVLLTMAIWKNGALFRQRYGMYMTALVISIIINLLSVSTILLIITMFISDWVWVKPDKDENVVIDDQNLTKEQKIEHLRKDLNDGKITREEFQEELMKLL